MRDGYVRQWRRDEDDRLIAHYAAGGTEEELAQLLGRSADDVGLRLVQLLLPKIAPALLQLDDPPPES